MTPGTAELTLRVVADHASHGPRFSFGLQDKAGDIIEGSPGRGANLTFECRVRVQHSTTTDQPNFLGRFTHGPPPNRHLYLSLRRAGDASTWIRCIKVPLAPITWTLIEAARDGALETEVDGRASATVPVSWQVTP